jgi:hypothetical protein
VVSLARVGNPHQKETRLCVKTRPQKPTSSPLEPHTAHRRPSDSQKTHSSVLDSPTSPTSSSPGHTRASLEARSIPSADPPRTLPTPSACTLTARPQLVYSVCGNSADALSHDKAALLCRNNCRSKSNDCQMSPSAPRQPVAEDPASIPTTSSTRLVTRREALEYLPF